VSFKLKSSQDIGPLFTDNRHNMVGQDGPYSIPLTGKVFWFFGDTLIGKRPAGSLWYIDGKAVGGLDMSGKGTIDRMITNTALLVENTNHIGSLNHYEYILDNKNQLRNIIPLLADENPDKIRIWCQHGIILDPDIYLSFIKVNMFKESVVLPVEFEILGSGFAKGRTDSWDFQRIQYEGSDLWWGKEDPRFATAIVRQDNYVYLFGVKQQRDKQQHCYLARVKADQFDDLSKYEYLVSPQPHWSSDISKAKSIFTEVPNELSVSFNSYLGKYLAVHSLGLSGKIIGRTADKLWGPWSAPVTLYQVRTEPKVPQPYPRLIYAGKEHPELARDNGRILYITYIEFEEYFPHLVQITID